MSNKIIGATVGTPISPKTIKEKINPILTVNGKRPDSIGNVEVEGNNGADGFSPTVSVTPITGGRRITIEDKNGTKTVDVMDGTDGKDGAKGADGKGIKSFARTSGNGAPGTTDTYTVTYTDNTTSTFAVYNGKDGVDGKDGKDGKDGASGESITVTEVESSTEDGGENIVHFSDGSSVVILNGSKGSAGRGIKSIAKTGVSGTTDTYTITYTDNTTSTFTVTNGRDGADGKDYVLTDADKSEIASLVDATEAIPDYVIEEAEATIAKVFTHGSLGRTIRFVAISDTHEDSAEVQNPQITISNKHAGQAIKYIADRIGLDFVAHLGDASSCGAWAETYEPDVLRDDIKNINKFIFSGVRGTKTAFIPGNHDMISMDGYSLLNSGAYILFGNLCSGNKDRLGGWGYFDIDDAKVRVIYLNTSDSPSSAAYLALTQSQKDWLCETLIDVNTKDNSDEWKVILLSHAPLDFGGANISTEILLPYVNGGSYNSYSFDGKNSAKIISNIHGHVHCFSYGYIGGKIRRFTIPNACFIGANHYVQKTEYADWADTVTYNKTANSGKDTAFSLVTIDLDSGKCYVDNYGAGIDREFSTDYNTEEETPKALLNLDRTYVSGTEGENIGNHLDESKAYLNVPYVHPCNFIANSCTATDITENSVTVKESGIGGICVAYPIHLKDIGTQAYRLTFDYSGVGKCRTYYKYATSDGVTSNTQSLYLNDTAGASGSANVTIPTSSGYEWLIIFFTSNTGSTKTFTNVSLTKV